jgi:hypothetical protein
MIEIQGAGATTQNIGVSVGNTTTMAVASVFVRQETSPLAGERTNQTALLVTHAFSSILDINGFFLLMKIANFLHFLLAR